MATLFYLKEDTPNPKKLAGQCLTILSDFKAQIPDPPKREEFVIIRGDDNLEVEIGKPCLDVYQTLINVDVGNTHLNFNINWKDTPLPDENKQGMLQAIKDNLESLKVYVENN